MSAGFQQMLSGLGAVRLKAVPSSEVQDSSAPKLTGYATEAEIGTYQNRVLDANIERWVDCLGGATFPSYFLPLTTAHARMFVDAYEALQTPGTTLSTLPQELRDQVASLETQLDPVIRRGKCAGNRNCVFVKTSSRSAKDSAILSARCKGLFHHHLAASADTDENARILAVLRAGTEMLKVRDAAGALDMLLQSERIYQDMKLALMQDHRFEENIVVRPWRDIEVDMEFRGFVYDGRLTALSQYNHLVYFPRLQTMREEIVGRIRAFYEGKVQAVLASAGFTECIVDFALLGDGHDEVAVIEINPFLDTTDGACFSWEKERHILQGEQSRVEVAFRLRERKMQGASALMNPEWRALLQS